jgi:hypothetical protein
MAEKNIKHAEQRRIKEGALTPAENPVPVPPTTATVIDPSTGQQIAPSSNGGTPSVTDRPADKPPPS